MGRLHQSRGGFTLIELSIVLVIIGLIVGGVLVGRDLIKAAELRSVITDKERFQTAVNTFRGKYDCLPGDCMNATTYFGTNPGCPDSNDNTGGTCNGNGDGQIDNEGWAPGKVYEPTRFWQQLGEAGLVAGTFTGWFQGYLQPNSSAVSRLPTGAIWWPNNEIGAWYGIQDNYLNLAQVTGEAWAPSISANDAYQLDRKIDDGNPNTGTMIAIDGYNISGGAWYSSGCVNGPATAYDLTQNAPYCTVGFLFRN
jgi:prepilin-type N-terminal cleavage/methylation domain-containing protein